MSSKTEPVATDIQLHQKSRLLEVSFDDGKKFELPCEYLRVFSPSAEVKALADQGQLVRDKQDVNITEITPVGHYAVQLHFDDGHDTGVYSWQTLYELGKKRDKNWQTYLDKLRSQGLEVEQKEKQLRILYFINLPDILDMESEEETVPSSVNTVADLLQFLRLRGGVWDKTFEDVSLKITINKRFAGLDSIIRDGDEIALVPTPPESMDADGA